MDSQCRAHALASAPPVVRYAPPPAQVQRSLQELARCTSPLAQVLRSRQRLVRCISPLAPPWHRSNSSIGRKSSIFCTLCKNCSCSSFRSKPNDVSSCSLSNYSGSPNRARWQPEISVCNFSWRISRRRTECESPMLPPGRRFIVT